MTFRVIATGDQHIVKGPRWDECRRIHDEIASYVEETHPALFLSGGDCYDRMSSPEERLFMAAFAKRVASVCPFVIVKGNHDAARDLALLAELESSFPISVVESCGVLCIHTHRPEAEFVNVMCMAWPDKAALAAMPGRLNLPHHEQEGRLAMQAVLRGLGERANLMAREEQPPRILLGHFNFSGSVTSTGQPLIGSSFEIDHADLMLARSHVVLGSHIHRAQDWMHGDIPIIGMGSPYRTNYGELEDKSFVELEFDEHRLVSWKRVPTSARRMIHVEAIWLSDELGGCFDRDIAISQGDSAAGAEIRFRYSVQADCQQQAAAHAAMVQQGAYALGAYSIKLEPVVTPMTRARVPEIATARTLEEKLDALWRSRNETISDERRAGLLSKLGDLERMSCALKIYQ